MTFRPPCNYKDMMLKPKTYAERLEMAEKITREILTDVAAGKKLSEATVKQIARYTLSMAEANVRMELLTTRRE